MFTNISPATALTNIIVWSTAGYFAGKTIAAQRNSTQKNQITYLPESFANIMINNPIETIKLINNCKIKKMKARENTYARVGAIVGLALGAIGTLLTSNQYT